MTHIEPSERGLYIDRKLAWTMAVAILGGGFWVGSTIAEIKYQTATLASSLASMRAELESERARRGALTDRLTALERTDARNDQRLITLVEAVARVERQQAEILRYIRQPDEGSR